MNVRHFGAVWVVPWVLALAGSAFAEESPAPEVTALAAPTTVPPTSSTTTTTVAATSTAPTTTTTTEAARPVVTTTTEPTRVAIRRRPARTCGSMAASPTPSDRGAQLGVTAEGPSAPRRR